MQSKAGVLCWCYKEKTFLRHKSKEGEKRMSLDGAGPNYFARMERKPF